MTESELTSHLRRLPHFLGVEPALLGRIAEGCRIADYVEGAWVFRQGELPRAFFSVLAGGVRLSRTKPDGREQVIHRLRSGQSFAEAAVMNMRAYPVHAVATSTPTQLLEIGREPLLALFDADPKLARAMVASLSSRLVRMVQRIDDLMIPDLEKRLARYLVDLPGETSADGTTVELPMRKKDLAAFLGIAPETLSRQLKRWRDGGLATSSGNRIVLHDLDAVLALTDD